MHLSYLAEFLAIAGVHLLAVASPGPDFAMVVRQSIAYGRPTALWTSVGIGLGILMHTTYSLLGIGLLIAHSLAAFTVVKILGALYLAYIGYKSLQAKAPEVVTASPEDIHILPTSKQALWTGFLTNALNPKATLFFLALFSVVISPATPTLIKAAYGLWMAVMTAVWFCGVSLLFSQPRVRQAFGRFGHWAERVMGAVLIAFGVRLALAR
ncbi:MAG: LysE family transporter [Abitibacteriaceae bacterium]|nr:LysE family transporter [Abditibacteriaceae bacterium]